MNKSLRLAELIQDYAVDQKVRDCAAAELRRLSAQVEALEADAAKREWQPIETAPTTGIKVILSYRNRNNKPRTVMARWMTEEEADESDHDGVGLEAGWYECIDNWPDYTQVAITEGKPTHWMPLPEAPAIAKEQT